MNRPWLAAQIALVVCFTGVFASCGGSRPVKYYALDVSAPPPSPAAESSVRLLVARVTSSQLYRDDRLVYGYGSLELGTYEYQRWAESPVDMIQDALVSSLRSTGQYRSVSAVGANLRAEYIVRSHLYALDEVDKPAIAARFIYELDLYDSRTQAIVWSQTYNHDEAVRGKKVADVVEALDENVRTGIEQLTAGLGQYFATHPISAPAKP